MIDKIDNNQYEQSDHSGDVNFKLAGLDSKVQSFLDEQTRLLHQKAQADAIVELESQETISNIDDQMPDDQVVTSRILSATSLTKNMSNDATVISSRFPQSSWEANEGRKTAISRVNDQIVQLPFWLDKFFANA